MDEFILIYIYYKKTVIRQNFKIMVSAYTSMHLVATVLPRVDKFPPPPGKLPKSRRRQRFFAKNRRFFAEKWQFLPKIGNFSLKIGNFLPKIGNFSPKIGDFSPNAANISIFRLLGDLARQYQVFWAKMPPMNLDQKGH